MSVIVEETVHRDLQIDHALETTTLRAPFREDRKGSLNRIEQEAKVGVYRLSVGEYVRSVQEIQSSYVLF